MYFSEKVFLKILQYSELKTLQHSCFAVNITKFLRRASLNKTPPVAASVFFKKQLKTDFMTS